MRIMKSFRLVLDDESGATALEYGFFVAFVAVILLGGAKDLADSIEAMFSSVASKVTAKTSVP